MPNSLSKSLYSISCAAIISASGAAGAADAVLLDSIDSGQLRQVAQEQDQTQYRNRQKLEQRINQSGDSAAAAQNRNRYRHQEQKRSRVHSTAGTGRRSYGGSGTVSGGPGFDAGTTGRRMAGSSGSGRR